MRIKKIAIGASLLSALFVAGCGDSDSGIPFGSDSGNNPNNPITAPTAGNIAFSALGGSATTATAANGILSVGNPNTATVVNVQSPTTRGGTITANADGSFTYNAPALGNTTDTFSYTIQNAGGSSTGTATVTLLGRGFFVNNQAAPGGTGTQQAPFQNLAQVQAAAAGVNGAEIVVFQGDGTNNGYNTAFALGANQTLRGFSQAATPLLTGPVTFSSGNRLEDVRIDGTVGSAINATSANNGFVNRVSVSNTTFRGVQMVNATGNWSIANSSFLNCANTVISTSADTGNLTWSATNCVFTNGTFGSMCPNATGNAAQNATISGCAFNNAKDSEIVAMGNTTAPFGLTVNNCSINGGGTAVRGVSVAVQSFTNFVGVITGNNITGCSSEGIQVGLSDNSSTRLKVASNRTQGNSPTVSVRLFSGGNATLCSSVTNNTADIYRLSQSGTNSFNIEDFGNFGLTNIGALLTAGNITSVAIGACGLP